MSKRRAIIFFSLILVALFIWQLPNMLRALPSRYVAAYLPESVQALAERRHVEILPTAEVAIDTSSLFAPTLAPPSITIKSETDENTPLSETPISGLSSNKESSATPDVSLTPSPHETPAATLEPIPFSGRIQPVKHQFQTWNNCGPATLAMALSYFDVFLTQDQTAAILKPDPEDRNVSPYEMAGFVKSETELSALDLTNGDLTTLKRLIAGGYPVIVELGLDPPGEYRWMGWYGHYLLVVAYDDKLESVWVYDSWFGTSELPGENADAAGRRISYADLDRYWRQFNRNFIVLFQTEQSDDVANIIGPDMDSSIMWLNAYDRVQSELAAEPDDPFLWFNLGTIYNALGDHEKAATAFDQARAIGLPWRMLWYQFGPYEAYYQVGRHQDVIMLTTLTLEDRPYFEESYYYKGLAEAALNHVDLAQESLEKAVRFNPNFSPAAEALAQLGT